MNISVLAIGRYQGSPPSGATPGADKDGGVNGGPFLFMMKPSISLSRPGGQILAVCAETRVSKICH